ncbi:MAG: cytochrome-ba3 oxidase subunit [Halobacteriota archaeon]
MVSPRNAALISLLALPAVIGYLFFKPDVLATVAAVNVLLITASLYMAFKPIEHGNGSIPSGQ